MRLNQSTENVPDLPGLQHGVALITALLVVALVTVAAVSMATRQHFDIRRTANLLQLDQAYVFALGGEVLAKEALLKDTGNSDHYEEEWALKLPPLPFQGGFLTISGDDLQGRFNVNNLANGDVHQVNWDRQRFTNLLTILGKFSDAPDELKNANMLDLTEALVDWIDSDSTALGNGGAEDGDYLGLERSYRAGNQTMADLSELLLVKGFTPDIVAFIRPYICALPGPTKINVNTAKNEVLQALAVSDTCPKINLLSRATPVSITDFLAKKGPGSFTNFTTVANFFRHAAFDNGNCEIFGVQGTGTAAVAGNACIPDSQYNRPPPAPQPDPKDKCQSETDFLDVQTHYFIVSTVASVGPEDRPMLSQVNTVLNRDNRIIKIISRSQGVQ